MELENFKQESMESIRAFTFLVCSNYYYYQVVSCGICSKKRRTRIPEKKQSCGSCAKNNINVERSSNWPALCP